MSGQTIKAKGKVFRDPVHRLIRIEPNDQFVLDLINTPEFQRLRRIRQLGVSSLTYHGAEHSRFVHSLGVFNFAQRIIASLQRRYGPTHAVSRHLEEHARVAKAAALLHDIGHGPFSHMIERAASSSFKHEDMTAKLIADESEGAVGAVLRSHSIEPQDVADVINGTYSSRLVVDIISSQLDADRMDYLLRDSLMTGVEYGVYDAEWLLNAMCVGLDPGWSESEVDQAHGWRLCLDHARGLFAAEQLILARHHMFRQVYMHRVTRGYEVMLLNLFRYIADLAGRNSTPSGTPSAVRAYFDVGVGLSRDNWLLFDEVALGAAIQSWLVSGDPWLQRTCAAYLRRERVLAAFELHKPNTTRDMEIPGKLASVGLRKNIDWGLDDGKHLPYKGILYTVTERGGDEEQSSLSTLLSGGEPSEKGRAIESASGVLKGLDNDAQHIIRLYVDREKLGAALPVLKKLGIQQGGVT